MDVPTKSMMTAVQTINAPATIAARNNRAASFGISPRDYLSLGRFSNAANKFGVKTVSIGRGAFGVGCQLQLSSSNHNYEVRVNSTGVLLGKIEASGKRTKLAEGSSNTEATWERLLETVKR